MTSDVRVSRRLILQAGAATTALGAPGFLLAQPAPIKIGLVHPVSGGLAYSGGQGRLGCQIVMSEALDGLVVRLPAATRNMMVDK